MQLYVKLDTHSWVARDFTDEPTLGITGTIYDDAELTNVFDLTGYTLTFRLKSQSRIIFDSDQDSSVSIVVAANGTFRYLPEYGDLLNESNGEVSIVLEKTGTAMTAIGINSSADLHVQLA